MIVRKNEDLDEFVAGDGSLLKEIFNPLKERLSFNYSIAYAKVNAGTATKKHVLENSELYYIIGGSGRMCVDGECEDVCAGFTVYIPPDSVQFIENTGETDLVFICIVDPPWSKDVEEVFDV